MPHNLTSRSFGRLSNGRMAALYTLSNSQGANVTFTDYGAALVSANMPDQNGRLGPVVLGFDTVKAYENNPAYMGVVIGPVAGRIGGGSFFLSKHIHHLEKNEANNCLHSGANGWHSKLWAAQPTNEGLQFGYETLDGENGFPGTVKATLDITLSQDNDLIYRFRAATNAPTPIAMTAHPYFNLADGGASRVNNHIVTIASPSIAQLDSLGITTGDLISPQAAGLGLREARALSEFIGENGELPFDHHYILAGQGLRHMARVDSPKSGRRLDVHGTADGIQFYTGQHIPRVTGHGKLCYAPSHGLALEPQARPNAVNTPFFPQVTLNPGEIYEDTIIYAFSLID